MIEYRDLFLTEKTVLDHVSAYNADMEKYMATFMLLQNSDVHLDWKVKEKVFGTFLIMKNESAIKYLFSKPFWTILDIRNVIRLVWTRSKKDAAIRKEMRNGRGVRKSRRQMLKDIITVMHPKQIERSILRHSYDAWREVIDYLHIPESAFPDYADLSLERLDGKEELPLGMHSILMKTIMDGTWPPTPFIKTMRSINQHNAISILREFPTEFHYLRNKIQFTPEIAAAYIHNARLANLLRWYEDLWYPTTLDLIAERIVNCQCGMIHQPYSVYFDLLYSQRNTMRMSELGKQLEADLIQRADKLTTRFNLPVKEPCLIAVDQSSSMSEEQVKIGTVIAAQAAAQLDSDLVYFYGDYYYGGSYGRRRLVDDGKRAIHEDVPEGTEGALSLVDKHQPMGNTPVAQIMKKYLYADPGNLVKDLQTLVLITDEGENDVWEHEGKRMDLALALDAYRNEVGHNIEIFIIRVSSKADQMEQRLMQFKFPVARYDIDDLRHIESLFALISAKSPMFLQDQQALANKLKAAPATMATYIDVDRDLRKYKRTRDDIFTHVIKGTCANCSGPLTSEEVTKFRFGGTITCPHCDFTLAPTLFGSHV